MFLSSFANVSSIFFLCKYNICIPFLNLFFECMFLKKKMLHVQPVSAWVMRNSSADNYLFYYAIHTIIRLLLILILLGWIVSIPSIASQCPFFLSHDCRSWLPKGKQHLQSFNYPSEKFFLHLAASSSNSQSILPFSKILKLFTDTFMTSSLLFFKTCKKGNQGIFFDRLTWPTWHLLEINPFIHLESYSE